MVITARITTGVSHSRETPALTAAATINTIVILSASNRRIFFHAGTLAASASWLGPYSRCRAATSTARSPTDGSTPSVDATSLTERVCQGAAVGA